ncbi:hypothetical protein CASFOL_000256 [Castilleja foliolosa]|uniref:RNase H type-1 domain-containing protein n=1 Tax=Castilleja foliolosa TaxID=1961234 RepID=A0ABD3EN64_9LAMI
MNQVSHGSSAHSIPYLTKLISRKSNAHWLSVNKSLQDRSIPNQLWNPPPDGWYEINIDSTFVDGKATAGIIIRNNNGSVILAAAHPHNCLDPTTAECLAIADACSYAIKFKLDSIIFESDCLTAISLINGGSNNIFWNADPVIHSIKKSWIFKFSPRSCNGAAHNLAK